MFALAFAIGIFSYIIFLLGMVGLLYKQIIIGVTIFYWMVYVCVWIFASRKKIASFLKRKHSLSFIFILCLVLLVVQAIVNSIGIFGPEIGFDALWYHLMLPKLYLQYHAIVHIPGGVLYYSDMPKLTEMLYTVGLSFSSEVLAKAIHYFFGVLSCIALYKVSKKYFHPSLAILASVIFYSNLVVGWESVSAYVDLSRTFFEILALWSFILWTETKKQEWFVKTALLVGLAITVKSLAIGSLAIYGVILLWYEHASLSVVARGRRVFTFVALAMLVPLPWFVFSLVHTGNPFYPLFSHINPAASSMLQLINPLYFIIAFWHTFAVASDPLNPLYLLSIPFIIIYWKKLYRDIPLLLLLVVGGIIVWYLTPFDGGGRYILPYLPAFTLVMLYTVSLLSQNWKRAFVVAVISCAVISIGYRAIANEKFVPVITGQETKAHFLSNHLDFSLGDFYDVDGYFASHIKPTDKVLLYGFHNLYYVNFPYIHSSWAENGDIFNYVAVQGNGLPERFRYWNLIYFNNTTQVRLYTPPQGSLWRY